QIHASDFYFVSPNSRHFKPSPAKSRGALQKTRSPKKHPCHHPKTCYFFGPFMKADIHPKYVDAEIRCACGNTIKTRSTKPVIIVGICNSCHPFYTGQQKFVDTAGRV